VKGAFLFLVVLRLVVAAPQSAPDQQLCAIKGTVTDALTHQGLRKAYLRLNDYPAVTDDRGAFTIDNIKPGMYVLTAEHPGYLDGEYGEADGAGVHLKLAPGQTLTDINVKLTPQAVISGRVVDEDGEVWTHAFVNLRRSRRVRGLWKIEDFGGAELNDQGEFRIGRIPPGKYYLSAQPEASWEARYQLPPPRRQLTWYPNSLDLEGATPIIVGPGSQITGVEIRIRRGSMHRISGTLAGIENIPPPVGPDPFGRRRISAESIGAAGNGTRSVINPDGSFEILGVPSGTYDLRVTQGFPSVNLGSAKVQVEDRDLDDVNIQLTPPQRLTGTIRFAEEGSSKLAGFAVELDPIRPARNSSAISRADGSFEFPLLGAERYRVNVIDNGLYLKEVRYGDIASNDGTVTVTGAGGSLQILLSRRVAHLTGKMSATAVGIPQVVLIPANAGDEVRQATLDQTGAFSFGDLRPGAYKLYAFEGAPDGAWEEPDFMKEFSSAGVEIHLDEGESKNVDVQLIPKSDVAPVLKKLGIE
jgi:hypothetical protein